MISYFTKKKLVPHNIIIHLFHTYNQQKLKDEKEKTVEIQYREQ